MSTVSERDQFRRLVGDYPQRLILDSDIDIWLDDAARERSAEDLTMNAVLGFSDIPINRRVEVIYAAALNWWWNRASQLADKHSQTVGQASQNVGEKFDRAMEMIQMLQTKLDSLTAGAAGIINQDLSRFSKSTLTRIGGQSEETALDGT